MAKQRIRHLGWMHERCRYGLLERLFAEEWMRENNQNRYQGYGVGILQLLLCRQRETAPFGRSTPKYIVTKRDAAIVATVIQWLGTNVGQGFLHKVFNQAGMYIGYKEDAPRDYYYSRQSQAEMEFHHSGWQNYMSEHGWPGRRPSSVADFTRPMRMLESLRRRRERLRLAIDERKNYSERRRCNNIITGQSFNGVNYQPVRYECRARIFPGSVCPKCDCVYVDGPTFCVLCREPFSRHATHPEEKNCYILCSGAIFRWRPTI